MLANHVGSLYPDNFRTRLGTVSQANLSATGNAVATIPITQGTSYIIRQITVTNANATVATGNVAILTSNDGNASNAVSNNVVLSNVTSTTTYQDLGLASGTLTAVYSSGSLFVKVNTAVSGAVDIDVYGDVVTL